MSEQEQEVAQDQNVETETQSDGATETQEKTKPSDTKEFWQKKAREQEKRAKDNKAAADELEELKQSQKSEVQQASDRAAQAEAEVAKVPEKVARELRAHLAEQHGISDDDSELFLTADDPDTLKRQVQRLVEQRKPENVNAHVPDASKQPDPPSGLNEQIQAAQANNDYALVRRLKTQQIFK